MGVGDPKLSASINEALGIKCSHIDVVPEVIRGIRLHFAKLVKGFTATSSEKAQLGLGHSYSRAKVRPSQPMYRLQSSGFFFHIVTSISRSSST